MATYRTRHLEALCDLEVGRESIPKGGKFFATEADAEYLNKKRPRVRDVPEPPPIERAAESHEADAVSTEDVVHSDTQTTQTLIDPPRRSYVRRTPFVSK